MEPLDLVDGAGSRCADDAVFDSWRGDAKWAGRAGAVSKVLIICTCKNYEVISLAFASLPSKDQIEHETVDLLR